LLLFYHFLAIHPAALESQAELLNTLIRVFKPQTGPRYRIDCHAPAPEALSVYRHPIRFFSSNLVVFAQCCCSFLKAHPDCSDRFTFSVIPGFFGSFWCRAIENLFGQFFSVIVQTDFDTAVGLGRVVFAIPEFGFFIEKVIDEMRFKGRTVGQGTAVTEFTDDFVAKWTANRNFCPSLTVSIMKIVHRQNPKKFSNFFRESFLKPALFN
jgi:hypothetical protein